MTKRNEILEALAQTESRWLKAGIRQAWHVTGDSAANTAQTVTRAAETGRRHVVTGFSVVVRAAAAGADVRIQLQDGATVIWDDYIGNAAARGTRVAVEFTHPAILTAGNAANLQVAAAGAGAITTANLKGFTVQ